MTPNSNITFHSAIDQNLPLEYQELYLAERNFLRNTIVENAFICEIGCGDGRSIHDLAGITENIIGVDYDQVCIKNLEKKYKNIDTIKFLCADAVSLPLQDEQFDTVICMMSWLNFGHKKEQSLKEMKRILKKHGNLIMSIFSEDALPIRLQVYHTIGIKIKEIIGGKVIFDEAFEANTSEQFTQNELQEIFDKQGLQITKIQKTKIGYICNLERI